MKKRSSVWLFLLGLFSMTEIRLVGSMAISELIIFPLAPFVFLADLSLLKRDGFMPFIWLVFATIISCLVSCVLNNTYLPMAHRGMATLYAIFAITVVMHHILRGNLNGMRWFILGWSLSLAINIFIFQKSTEIGRAEMLDADVAETIMTNHFLWTARIGDWLMTPIRGWFLQIPILYSILAPLVFAVYFIFASESGRSAALVSALSSIFLLLGGKQRRNMDRVRKHFGAIAVFAFIFLVLFKTGYSYSAKTGMLGEKAQKKYESQTGGRDSALAILMGGRPDFFMGLVAAVRKPFFGYGPWPIDEDNVAEQFLYKYGSAEDVAKHEQMKRYMAMAGLPARFGWIPTHSHLIGFWVWYGLAGLLLWVYVLIVIIKIIKNGLAAVPQWYGMLCIYIPSMLWHIFFSPFGSRVPSITMIACVLFAKAIAERRLQLPLEMELEAREFDRK